jgi:glutaconate CoA-transferase subunit B
MRLQSLHAGETLEAVRAGVAWPLATAPEVAETPPPTDEELRLIAELDPRGVYRKT